MEHFISIIILLFVIGAANAALRLPFHIGEFHPDIVDPKFDAYQSTKFKLLTPENCRNPINFTLNSIPIVKFNKNHKTLFVIHGFTGTDYMTDAFKKACFENGHHDVNLVGVDWTAGSQNPTYAFSALRVERVGKAVANLIALAVLNNVINIENVEVVGHSLGAHCAGYVGKHLKNGYDLKLPLIVGLDPAGPLFTFHCNKLQKNDADKVVVIHTNDDYGHLEPFGGVDVYLNGGKKQPGLNDQESHCFAAEFYKGLLNIQTPLIAHQYRTYHEIQYGMVPPTTPRTIFHNEPLPRDGTMLYIDTLTTQKDAMPELERLDVGRNPPPSSFNEIAQCFTCNIL